MTYFSKARNRKWTVVLFSLMSCVFFAPPLHAGWEVLGGDLVALKFVKMSRATTDEIAHHPECPLNKKLNLNEMNEALDKVEVASSRGALVTSDKKGIHLNKHAWIHLPLQKKIETVLEAYSAQTSQPYAPALSPSLMKSCFTMDHFKNTSVSEELQSREEIKNDFGKTSLHLLNKVTSLEKANLINADQGKILRELISQSRFDLKGAGKDKVTLMITSQAISIEDGKIKDGVNIKNDTSKEKYILIYPSLWGASSEEEKMAFLLHEYLGLMKIEDSRYQISSKL